MIFAVMYAMLASARILPGVSGANPSLFAVNCSKYKKMSATTTKLTVYLLLYFLFVILLPNLIMIFSGTPWTESSLYEAFVFFHRSWYTLIDRFIVQGADSWAPMITAYDYTEAHPDERLYDEVFFRERTKFQYPPTALLPIALLKSVTGHARTLSLIGALGHLSLWAVALMAVLVCVVFQASLQRATGKSFQEFSKPEVLLRSLLLIAFTVTFHPLVRGLRVGNIQTWISAGFAVVFFCWIVKREVLAGVFAAAICLLKPHYALLLLWAALRKKHRFLISFAAAGVAGLLLSVILFGTENHLNYLNTLSFLSRRGESYYANQSMNGLLHRIFLNGPILDFDTKSFPPFHAWVYWGTLLSSIALLIPALIWRFRASDAGSVVDFSVVSVTATIASPIAWDHHYGVLLPIFAFLLPRVIYGAGTGKKVVWLAVSYALLTNFYYPLNDLARGPRFLNVLISYQFVGGLMLLSLLYYLRLGEKSKISQMHTKTDG